MGSEWTDTTVGALLEKEGADIQTGPFGTKLKASEYADEGVPVISVGEVRFGRLEVHEKTPLVPTTVTSRMPEYLLRRGDIVFGRKGAVERSGLVTSEQDGWFLGSDGIRIRLPGCCHPRFVSYHLLTRLHKNWMIQNAAGTTMPSLNESIVKRIPLRLPPLKLQKSIAHILGTLDDKIELNRRMNVTLESMARALFKSWFVDFDPVIDNALAAGNPIPEPLSARAQTRRDLGTKRKPLPKNIQKLFPDSFVFDDDVGWIPEGWEIETVGSEFNVTMGQSPPGHTYNEDQIGTPFFQGRRDFGFRFPSRRVYCTAPKRMATKDDTLVSVRAPVGDVNMAAEECCVGRGVAAVRHQSGGRSFTYYAMLQLSEYFKVFEAEGTVFGSINQKDFNALPQLICPSQLVMGFGSQAEQLDEKIELNSAAIEALTKLRDTLLPQLLSGELRIPDAEKLVAGSL